MKRNKYVYFVIFTLLLMFASVFRAGTFVKAAVPTTQQVYNAAPKGITNLSKLMESPTTYTKDSSNKTFTSPMSNSQSILTSYPSQIIQMTSGKQNQVGSIWGKRLDDQGNAYNQFDLTKSQTLSAWMYFGGNTSELSDKEESESSMVSDGMAFVLQNDQRKNEAISTTTNVPMFGSNSTSASVGQSLGVWGGSNPTSSPNDTAGFAASAIQNSFAIEFDTYKNEQIEFSNISNGLDSISENVSGQKTAGQHISWNYPGDSSSYQVEPVSYPLFSSRRVYKLVHNRFSDLAPDNPIISNIIMAGYEKGHGNTENAWHHFTFQYTPPKEGSTIASINYIFNDKDYDGTIKAYNQWDQRRNQKIDISKIDPNGTGKAMWGFTSATGNEEKTPSATNAIVMQTMPGMAEVEAPTSLYDETQGRNILDLNEFETANSTVSDGDSLRFDYDLNYKSGTIGTGDITTEMNLPSHVDFKSNADGNVGQIVYGEGDGQRIIPIPASDITSDNHLTVELESVSKTNAKIKIQLFGKADIEDSGTLVTVEVDPEHTSYTSDYYVEDVMSPKFRISNEVLELSPTSTTEPHIKLNESGALDLTASYEKKSTFDGNDLTFYTQVDDGDVMSTTSSTIANKSTADYKWAYKASELGLGEHTVKIYAKDANSRKSNVVTFNITVEDYKKIVLSSENLDITGLLSDDTKMAGTAKYANMNGTARDDDITKPGATLYWSLDGGKATEAALTDKDFLHTIPANTLTEGKHTVTVYADDGTRKSNTLTYNLNIINSSATLNNEKDYKFQTINRDNEENRIVRRSGDWGLSVDSINSAWKLTATASEMVNSAGQELNGNLIYVTNDKVSDMSSPTFIDEDTTITKERRTKDIAKTWGNNSGILLKVQPSTTEGTYTGKIAWTLTSSVE